MSSEDEKRFMYPIYHFHFKNKKAPKRGHMARVQQVVIVHRSEALASSRPFGQFYLPLELRRTWCYLKEIDH